MKRTISFFSLLLMSLISLGQSFSIGGGFAYGDDIKEPGINLRAYYNLPSDKICFGPEFSTFLTHTENISGEEVEVNLYEFNFNIHYIFEVTHKFWGVSFNWIEFQQGERGG